ncbi:nucleotidyltransferase family protein [Amylibacter sp.]|nr:nucleotidyltransferase family protein [Amylibacter sp.]
MSIESALIFGAGFGTRMGDITKITPKPMIRVLNKPLIDYAIDVILSANIQNISVNLHHLPKQIEDHLSKFENIQTIHEQPNILETGGGLKNALPILGSSPVGSLLKSWDPKKMDALLMLIPIQNTKEYCGQGDFYLDSDNLLTRRGNKPNAPYVYTGAQIIKTELLSNINEKSFSINLLWNKILNKKKAFGIVYDGSWIDVGHPKGIDTATKELLNNRNV